jgi:hypothetical protein
MRTSLAIWLLVVACAIPRSLPAQTSNSPAAPLTLTQYVRVLDDALAAVHQLQAAPQKTADLVRTLPVSWQVESGGRNFEISTESLRRDLGAWQAKPTSESIDLIVQHLETLRDEAAGSENISGDLAGRHVLLSSILSRSEFSGVHGPSLWDRFKQRVTDFLLHLLGRLVSSSSIPMISDILVYSLIVIAVLAVGYWLYRSLRDGTRLETIMPNVLPVSAKEWPLWLAEARAAAARGEWRDAIHLGYWGGISFLEAQGAWRPDRARTPREYLRLLPASSAHQPALRALTMRLEGVWYGMQVAGADGFEQTLAELERLGCPCN